MLEKQTLENFILEWNYEVNLADDIEDPETLEMVKSFVRDFILEKCGIENPPIRFYNKKAQIEIIAEEDSAQEKAPRLTLVGDSDES